MLNAVQPPDQAETRVHGTQGWTRPPADATEQKMHQQAGGVSLTANSSPLVILEEALQLIVYIDLQAGGVK